MKKLLLSTVLLAVFGLSFNSCKDTKKQEEVVTEDTVEVIEEAVEEEKAPNIVEVAAANENFSTLVAAVKAADLVEVLSGTGPFTVFAPTNDAFAKLPEGTVDNLLKPENKATLSGILTYHVVSGTFDAAAVVEAINANDGAFEVTTVQGNTLVATLNGTDVIIKDAKGNAAKVVIADVAASNGVIHAIDTVVMPE
ncbi:fasciclin domain-containing protein [Oceanihabitans sp. IOP_32]|uniref:fasciclin domain-containing protein n=1 Tax=Oceanihabitans sp. IOP_32 TaxID=2529032 RepID=UPI001293995F|nr:fasciclin domain-containing protein [Oceanihabitans sp. IOP_32]QFZ55052.1 fasciclin domain-containing protein [Oceanihabitans sp. IOP_32]